MAYEGREMPDFLRRTFGPDVEAAQSDIEALHALEERFASWLKRPWFPGTIRTAREEESRLKQVLKASDERIDALSYFLELAHHLLLHSRQVFHQSPGDDYRSLILQARALVTLIQEEIPFLEEEFAMQEKIEEANVRGATARILGASSVLSRGPVDPAKSDAKLRLDAALELEALEEANGHGPSAAVVEPHDVPDPEGPNLAARAAQRVPGRQG